MIFKFWCFVWNCLKWIVLRVLPGLPGHGADFQNLNPLLLMSLVYELETKMLSNDGNLLVITLWTRQDTRLNRFRSSPVPKLFNRILIGNLGGGGNLCLPINANCPNLLISKFRGKNSNFGKNWQKLAKIRFFLGYRFLAMGRGR